MVYFCAEFQCVVRQIPLKFHFIILFYAPSSPEAASIVMPIAAYFAREA